MNPMDKTNYVNSGGSHCPFCGDDYILGGHLESDTSEAWMEVTCQNCSKSWYDIYKLVDIEEVNQS